MKKYIFAVIALVAAVFTTAAAPTYDYTLLVNTKAGSTVEFAFVDYPTATFEGDEVIIADDAHLQDVRFDMADIENFTFSKTTGIDQVKADSDIQIRLTKEALAASGLKAGATVNIYNLTGTLVATARADADGNAYVALEGIGTGVFVASMPGTTFKFIR